MFLPLLAAAALAATDVTLETSDGQRIHAIAEPVDGAKKGVVLVHMLDRSAADWKFLTERLNRSKISVVAPDLRGHGENVGDKVVDLTDADYQAMVEDVRASVAWLRSKGVTEVSCAGASIGANLCMRMAAEDPQVVNLVLLSPGLNYKGVTTGDTLEGYGNRPMLLVASSEDAYSARSATLLEEKAKGQRHLMLLEKAGHGTKMLNRDPALEGVVVSWLLGTYELASGEMVMPRPSVGADVGNVETTGKKLDSHR